MQKYFFSRQWSRRLSIVLYLCIILLLLPYTIYLLLVRKYVEPLPFPLELNIEQLEAESKTETILNGLPMPLVSGLSQRFHPIIQLNRSMDVDTLWRLFHNYMARRDVECTHADVLGSKAGGWPVCLAGPYQPPSGSCRIILIGNGPDQTFRKSMFRTYKCAVSHSSETDMATTLSHVTGVIHYLRVDVDDVCDLLEQVNVSQAFSRVRQIGLHIHLPHRTGTPPGVVRSTLLDCWRRLEELRKAGFYRWYHHLSGRNWFKRLAGIQADGHAEVHVQVFVNVRHLRGQPHLQQPTWVIDALGTDHEEVPPPPRYVTPPDLRPPCPEDGPLYPHQPCRPPDPATPPPPI